MKLSRLLPIAALACLAVVASCKPSEESYRQAYEAAKNRDTDVIEETIYNKIRQRARPQQIVVGADTLDYRVEGVTLTGDDGAIRQRVKRYNVVVGQFKQIFNARAMTEAITSRGYDGFIVNTAEPLYYVVAAACSTNEEALRLLQEVEKRKDIPMKDPYPLVVCPARKR